MRKKKSKPNIARKVEMRKKNQSQISHIWVLKTKAEKQTNEQTLYHLSENVYPQKNLYRFFSFNFYIELFGVFVRKSFLENVSRLSFSS